MTLRSIIGTPVFLSWHNIGDGTLFVTGAMFLHLWLRDRNRWLNLRYAMSRHDAHIERLEWQHDLAQDAVAAADRGDMEKLSDALYKLRTTFREEAPAYSGTSAVVWPVDEPKRFNGRNQPCDMWTGPCSCGAWHREGK